MIWVVVGEKWTERRRECLPAALCSRDAIIAPNFKAHIIKHFSQADPQHLHHPSIPAPFLCRFKAFHDPPRSILRRHTSSPWHLCLTTPRLSGDRHSANRALPPTPLWHPSTMKPSQPRPLTPIQSSSIARTRLSGTKLQRPRWRQLRLQRHPTSKVRPPKRTTRGDVGYASTTRVKMHLGLLPGGVLVLAPLLLTKIACSTGSRAKRLQTHDGRPGQEAR